MSKESFSVEYSGNINYKSKNIGLCKFYPTTIEGYKQAVQDLKVYKAHQSKHIEELEHRLANCIEPKKDKGDKKEKFNGKRPIDDLASEFGLELGYTATQIQNYLDQQIRGLKGE